MMSSFVMHIIGGHSSRLICRLGYFIQLSVCNRMNVNVNVDVFTTSQLVTLNHILGCHKLHKMER